LILIHRLAEIKDIEPDIWYEFNLQTDDALISLMLLLKDDKFTAFKNSCPHQGRRMNYSLGQFLITSEGNLVCPAHGAEFKPDDGLCINGPCLGQSLEFIHIQLNDDCVFAIIP